MHITIKHIGGPACRKRDERLRRLCELAVQEEDPELFLDLVQQIEEAIDEKLASLRKSHSGFRGDMRVKEDQLKDLTRQLTECDDKAEAIEIAKRLRLALHKYLQASYRRFRVNRSYTLTPARAA